LLKKAVQNILKKNLPKYNIFIDAGFVLFLRKDLAGLYKGLNRYSRVESTQTSQKKQNCKATISMTFHNF